MIIEIILLLIFIISALGMGIILVRQMPAAQRLAETPQTTAPTNFSQASKNFCITTIKKIPCFRNFNWLIFTQKILMKGRVMVLKIENKINDYILKLHQQAEVKRGKNTEILDNYWHDLKIMVKSQTPPKTEANIFKNNYQENQNLKSTVVNIKETITSSQSPINIESPVIKHSISSPTTTSSETINHKKKRNQTSKKRRFKDPFQW